MPWPDTRPMRPKVTAQHVLEAIAAAYSLALQLDRSRAASVVLTKLDEARMWGVEIDEPPTP